MAWKAALVFDDDSEIEIPEEYDSRNEAFNEGLDYGDEYYSYSDKIHVWNTDDPDDDHMYTRR